MLRSSPVTGPTVGTGIEKVHPKKPPRTLRPAERTPCINSTEVCLRALYEMWIEDGITATRGSLAKRLDVSWTTASQLVDRMTKAGLVGTVQGRCILLTGTGRAAATAVVRKHRLAERLLHDIVGLEWERCHLEATRWQHVLGLLAERKLAALLSDPTTSPYGDPIPGLDELDPALIIGRPPADPSVPLSCLARTVPHTGRVRRVPDRVQEDRDLLRRLRTSGVVPGATISAARPGDESPDLTIETTVGRITLGTLPASLITATPTGGR